MAFMIFNPVIAVVIRIALGLLFVISAILKIPALRDFYVIFLQYGVLKGRLAKFAAYSLPFAELFSGIALLAGFRLVLSSGAILLLLVTSTVGILYALYKHKKLKNCGCYGIAIKSPLTYKKLVSNVAWLLCALYLFLFYLSTA